ncbi:MAG: cytochrome b/b6 domain-containing protein [Pseudomonadota bacterium]
MAETTRRLEVWDLPTRLVHWALVVLVFLAWLSQEFGQMDRHMMIGYTILTLVLFRIVWGLYGSEPSRFVSFVRGPRAVVAYARDLLRGRPPKLAGHNPLGALAIVALLGLLLVQATAGLFADDDIFTQGPLAKLVSSETSSMLTNVHETVFWVLLGVIAVHVAAAAAYAGLLKQDLVRPMIHGRKTLPADTAAPSVRNPLWALPAAAFAAGVVWYVVNRL